MRGGGAQIAGESQDAQFKSALQILSYQWGADNPASIGSGTGGAGAGKVKLSPFVFTTQASSAMPTLFQICAGGEFFSEMLLSVRKAGGKQQVYLTISFKTVFITKFTQKLGPDLLPIDEYHCEYGSAQVSYKAQKADGTLGPALTGAWNQINNNNSPLP